MTGTRVHLGALAVVGALIAVLLAGCGDDDQADPKPSFSPTPSVSSTSSSPVVTSSSATPVSETPEAFIRRWLDLDTEMQNSGVTSKYLQVTTHCQPCTKTARLVERFYHAGGYIKFEGHSLGSISRVHPATGPVFEVVDTTGKTEYKSSASSTTQFILGQTVKLQVTLSRQGNSWLVSNYVQLAS